MNKINEINKALDEIKSKLDATNATPMQRLKQLAPLLIDAAYIVGGEEKAEFVALKLKIKAGNINNAEFNKKLKEAVSTIKRGQPNLRNQVGEEAFEQLLEGEIDRLNVASRAFTGAHIAVNANSGIDSVIASIMPN